MIGSLLLHQPDFLFSVTPYVTIFARMSPQQKGDVIRATKARGIYCLMCGDGTNDVAALKQSHVGVSIMSNVEIEDYIANREAQYNALENKSSTEDSNEQFDLFVSQMKSPALQVAKGKISQIDYLQNNWGTKSTCAACSFSTETGKEACD